MIRRLLSVFLLLATVLAARAEVRVRNPQFGFGGGFVQGRFNLLSIEVDNPGGKAFDGVLELVDADYGGSSAPYVQAIYLAPGQSRWVQFVPFVGGYQRWTLRWRDKNGGAEDSVRVNRGDDDAVTVVAPVTVLLTSATATGAQQARMRTFPGELFPPSVTATEGLYGVVLDHVPKWDAPRRQAFMDWLRLGGRVHLLHSAAGGYPVFTDELAPLNIEGERGAFGAGLVERLKHSRAELELKHLGPQPEVAKQKNTNHGSVDSASDLLFGRMAGIVKPDVPWGVIYVLTVVYVAIIGPVFFLQRRRDYRLLLAAFVGTVAVFAWLFTVVGRRGYGERQVLHTVGYAEALGGSRFLVTQWIHAFATSSDTYSFKHPGPGHAYAAQGENETVRGQVTTGGEAGFSVDIPLFSSRPFVHRGVVNVERLGWTVDEWKEKDGWFPQLKLSGPAKGAGVINPIVVLGDSYKELTPGGDGKWTVAGDRSNLTNYFSRQNYYHYHGHRRSAATKGQERIRELLGDLNEFMVSAALARTDYLRNGHTTPKADDVIRIFYYAPAPAEFAPQSGGFATGGGYILFSQTLRKPQ